MNLKSLAKDTIIYGLSSIIARFLNYLLVPIHTYKIAAETGNYGMVTNLYSYTALFLALLTFGMETTLFRFSNREGVDANKVYGNSLRMVGTVALTFVALVLIFIKPISSAMGYAIHPSYVGCMAIIVAMDAFQAIMFSRLRLQHRPLKFMALKVSFIVLNVLLNLFIFMVMPNVTGLSGLYHRFDDGVGLVFFANLLCTTLVFIGFADELKGLSYGFDKGLAKQMLKYTWPLLLLSLVGVLPQVADKILYPQLVPGHEGQVQLGIYGACVKIAMIMSLLTQAFRYAYEPIVFNNSQSKRNPETLAEGMKYFVIFTMLAFLAVMFYMPILRHLVQKDYWEGLGVVPIVMLGEIFMGIYFNLSFWYKLSDKTYWGAILSFIGAVVMITINVIFVPKIGYWACAWGCFAGYGTPMLMSYFIGRKRFPVPYDFKTMGMFLLLTCALYALGQFCFKRLPIVPQIALDTLLLLGFCFVVYKYIVKTGALQKQ